MSLNLLSVANISWFWFLLCSASPSCLLAFARSNHLHTSPPLSASLIIISLLLPGGTFRAPCHSPFACLSCLSLHCLTPPYSPLYKPVKKAAHSLFCLGLPTKSLLSLTSWFSYLGEGSSSPTCNAQGDLCMNHLLSCFPNACWHICLFWGGLYFHKICKCFAQDMH